jgi:hypothetical protein
MPPSLYERGALGTALASATGYLLVLCHRKD